MTAWERRAEEVLRPFMGPDEDLEVVGRAQRFTSLRSDEARRRAATGGAIGFLVAFVPLLVAGGSWGLIAFVSIPFGLMGAVSAYEFGNHRYVVGLTDRRLLVVPHGRPDEALALDLLAAPDRVGVEVRGRTTVIDLPDGRRLVLLPSTPEDVQAAAALAHALRA